MRHLSVKEYSMLSALILGLCFLAVGAAYAADQDRTQTRMEMQHQIYGSSMMTEHERNTYRQRMRNAKSAQEREQIRAEHHKQMQERAKQRGIKLPDMPPAGHGMGQGNMNGGMGGGMGRGR